ncbi:hypothetical protein [Photobacterium galatheae]|uniref:Uncharacterized protein n=1 Tax=Photobacterium galatheae TaxID=1654360 RepID=A0A066RKY4_9GAMM|nr:hypothetical protein [Photobacterium galatheae]KDM91100.1 hypothetical protein EA58_13180 [Photobacterium galatheae]MCM0150180.1 hypothetical protein [Photobacterium galatheae]
MEKVRYVKASYTPLEDITPLHRNVVTQPVEPVPDHKLVVELAGQWPGNRAYLILAKTETQSEKIEKPRADSKKDHRSLVEFDELENEAKNLYLAIPSLVTPMPIKILLAKGMMPVVKQTEMDEWETVLVPVVPMYFTTEDKDPAKASLYEPGYVYILRDGKVWREIYITEHGYFSEVNLTLEVCNDKQRQMVVERHVDITLVSEETGARYSYEPYEVKQDGKTVLTSRLDASGMARVFGLTAEEVEIVLTDYSPVKTFTFSTKESPKKGGRIVLREPEGMSVPHIWLPYKINGETVQLHAIFCTQQQTSSQLSELEQNYESRATEITGMATYTKDKSFTDANSVIQNLTIPESLTPDSKKYSFVNKQINRNIAAVYLNAPQPEIRLTYYAHPQVDQPDDYFELSDSESEWTQKVYLRSCDFIDQKHRMIRFSGWPSEVKKVTLSRTNKGSEAFDVIEPVIIYKDIDISELFN